MRRKLTWLISLVLLFVSIVAFREPAERYFDIAKSLDIFATLFKEVNAYYVDEVEPEKLIRKSIDGMLESLDPYTDFIPEEEIESFRITTTGQYGGIGALIGVINNKTVITDPYPGFPAHKAGLKVGDEIIAVDGIPVTGKSTADISNLLKGQPRTEVSVTIRRYGVPDFTTTIKREKINISNLAYHGMIEPGVGYIKLDDFTPGAGKEVAEAVVALKQQGAEKLILDLRDNPGGLLHEAVNVVSIFVPKGSEVVSTRGKVAEWNKKYTTLNNPIDTAIPLAVLTSEGSASASEIVAGALQDYDRAVLVGKKTFGKGLVQTTRSLSYNSQLKVTTAKYYIPSGRCIQELDYAHRKDDGSVDKLADSLKMEFKTANGRSVYDGGGLEPDIKVGDRYLGAVTVALISKGFIFDYASVYCAEHPDVPTLKSFLLSDREYDKFVSWMKEKKFQYTTNLEKETNDLIASAKKEKYYADIEGQLTMLKKKIENDKATDMLHFKEEIREVLGREIAFHYATHQGEAEYALSRDRYVLEAKKILQDTTALRAILHVKSN